MHKTVFVGNSAFAVPALRAIHASPHEVACIVTRKDRPSGRGLKLKPTPVAEAAERLGLELHRAGRPGQANPAIEAHEPDFLVVCDCGDMISRSTLRLPRKGCLNIHPSLLPRWRGAAPIERAILAGDRVTGVSIMLMNTGLDSGPVLMAEELSLENSSMSSGDLREELAKIGARLAVRTLDKYESLTASFQDESNATYAGKIRAEETEIDWRLDAERIERMVRAFHPSPGAGTRCGRMRIRIGEARAQHKPEGDPGRILEASAAAVTVGCGSGSLAIRRLQRAGGRMLPVRDFLNGVALEAGMRFEGPDSSGDRANPS